MVTQLGVDFINFLPPIRALRPTFEKLFIGVRRALRRALSFDRAISMICALRPTFMKSTLDWKIDSNYMILSFFLRGPFWMDISIHENM